MKNSLLPLALLVLLFGCPSSATGEEVEPVTFDHGAYDKLLGETVENGRVDYAALKKQQARLDAYLGALADTSKGAKVVLEAGRPPVLELSLVFKWFKDDFRKSAGSVLGFVLPYLPARAGESLRARKHEVRIQFLDYDWRLNKR